jgi:hypothetical protein
MSLCFFNFDEMLFIILIHFEPVVKYLLDFYILVKKIIMEVFKGKS